MSENPEMVQGSAGGPSMDELAGLLKRHKGGASWFYWIAGLSLVNSVIQLAGSDRSFLIGLGATQIVDAIALMFNGRAGHEGFSLIMVLAFVVDLLVAGIFVLFGWLSMRMYRWAYLIGIALYLLDGLILLPFGLIGHVCFHAFALLFMFSGFTACGKLKPYAMAAVDSAQAVQGAPEAAGMPEGGAGPGAE